MAGSYLFVLRRRLSLILALTLVSSAVLFLLLQSRPLQYESQAVIEVGTGSVAEQVIGQPSAYEEPERRASTTADAVTNRPVAELAAQSLGVTDLDQLVDRISAEPRPGTDFIDVRGTGPTAANAQQVTEAFTTAFLEYRRSTQRSALESLESELLAQRADAEQELAALPAGADRDRDVLAGRIDEAVRLAEAVRLRTSIDQIGVELLSEPTVPDAPSNALPPLLAAVASLFGGAFMALGLVFVIDLLRDGVRTRREVEQLSGAPVIASLSSPWRLSANRASMLPELRGLRLGLSAACDGVVPGRILVVAVAGEEQLSQEAAALLGAALCGEARPVLLLTGDAGGASGTRALTPDPEGAALTLAGGVVARESLHPNVWISSASGATTGPGLFDSASPDRALRDADHHFATLVTVADTKGGVEPQVVSHLFEALVLVCSRGRTRARRIRSVVESLQQSGRPVTAAVLVDEGGVRAKMGRQGTDLTATPQGVGSPAYRTAAADAPEQESRLGASNA